MPWGQEGDFDKVLQVQGSAQNRKVRFFNKPSNTDVSEVYIYGYKSSDNLRCIEVYFTSDEVITDFKKLMPPSSRGRIHVSYDTKRILLYPTEIVSDLADFIRTLYKIDRLDEKTRLGISLCLNFTVEILKEPYKPLASSDQQTEIMMLLKEIKAQNELLINKVNVLAGEVASLKQKDLKAPSPIQDTKTEQTTNANLGLFKQP